ncbi:MAG: sigma-70 family RNA polymerase sigma factor [Candidatus Kapabacteria bacterium]|nr:sigma-70 family RNA polymerase sigma factor [Candidatus Kapabacteria bacterium]
MASRSFGSIENDKEFVERILAKDPDVFTDIVKTYKKQVYYLALDLSRSHDDAEDITQDVFIRVYKALGQFRGDSKLSTWLYRITMNTFINRTRSLAYEASKTSAEYDDEYGIHSSTTTVGWEANPEHVLTQKFIDEHLKNALDSISPAQRTVFMLRHYHDMALKDIAEQMGNTEGTVKVLLFRAVHNLQKKLAFYKDSQ